MDRKMFSVLIAAYPPRSLAVGFVGSNLTYKSQEITVVLDIHLSNEYMISSLFRYNFIFNTWA